MLKHVMKYEDFVNESKLSNQYGMDILKEQGEELGEVITSLEDLQKDMDYCIVNLDYGKNWVGGWQ